MRMILIFQPDAAALTPSRIAESLEEGLGLVGLLTDGESKTDPEDYADGDFSEGDFYIELPDLAEDEGEPTANYSSIARADRDETIAEIVKELVEQEDSLKSTFETNGRDLIISFEDTPAGIEAGSVLAYAVASAVGAGVLLPAFDGDEETFWFEDAEDFADYMFSDDEDDEEGDEPTDEPTDEKK